MRKRLSFMTNEKGFIFPYVLFVTALVFVGITAGTQLYRNELISTEVYLNQIKLETLFQMTKEKALVEQKHLGPLYEKHNYTFPSGSAKFSVQIRTADWNKTLIEPKLSNGKKLLMYSFIHLEDPELDY